MESHQTQSDRDRMVRDIAGVLAKGGYRDLRADAPGFDRPSPIRPEGEGGAYVPDVLCNTLLVAVETDDSIRDALTEAKWCAFGGFAKRIGLRFIVGVPLGREGEAKNQLRKLGLEGEVLAL